MAAGSQPCQSRIFCWSTSRSLSTVFMKCLGRTEGALAWLEPFATADFFGPEARLPTQGYNGSGPSETKYTPAWVQEQLEGAFEGHSLIFVKDFAFAIADRLHFLPKGFRHSFLIRHPMKTFMSFYHLVKKASGDDDFKLGGAWLSKGLGFQELAELAEYVESDLREPLVIVDADDILSYPDVMAKKYCSALKLPFSDSILTWEPGIPSNWIVADSVHEVEEKYHWMGNALSSRGFNKGIQKCMESEEVPQPIKEIIEAALPFYDKLYARRILPF